MNELKTFGNPSVTSSLSHHPLVQDVLPILSFKMNNQFSSNHVNDFN
ncbi:hypothetical protein BBR47_53960 [Brevibacillus brevis NBRC 100599]|uniref:Uncharacterized protein n=1 Tax=Brevibacillus brevis (strain 47 / JCM 6285 / NBRC 100599) TaxID=358681 RepID=C0Z724_BREBN|nr:hypothetical protein BBR47_28980 [Brevibacillus brevis NBRC 100599]BAH46373.1 hypothetical protein BBR47_53960 [Brevibacillus brevis NBRC 100599]